MQKDNNNTGEEVKQYKLNEENLLETFKKLKQETKLKIQNSNADKEKGYEPLSSRFFKK